ncbi:unnamed protein product [Brachionus calyciflorus]|uniref:Uncharacterized protein n=1 Tax=Brachionus calyciflorus TaxID=104777 RepID=A0A814C1Q5_9BILA|nr:unnamed protein product [Brachionus calyciflorus]
MNSDENKEIVNDHNDCNIVQETDNVKVYSIFTSYEANNSHYDSESNNDHYESESINDQYESESNNFNTLFDNFDEDNFSEEPIDVNLSMKIFTNQ